MNDKQIRDVDTTSLKELGLNKEWLQKQIEADPKILGLAGDISCVDCKKQQPSGGRFDLLLKDEGTRHYEVKIQLGAINLNHIICTNEYWNGKRKQDPQQKHKYCAVIVAEEITGRLFNAIEVLHKHIPLIAIKLTTVMYPSGEVGLLFTKVLDELKQPSSRKTWEQEHGQEWVKCAKNLFDSMRPGSAKKEPNYARGYIAMQKDGKHILWLKHQKDAVHVEFACPARNHELEEELKNAGAKEPKYYPDVRPVQYRFNVPLPPAATLPKLSAAVKRILEGNNLGEQEQE